MTASAARARRLDYVLINGHGRSGTNWLKDILDCSTETHCRNEPDWLTPRPYDELPPKWLVRSDTIALEAHWTRTIDWAARRVGDWDRPIEGRKNHLHPFARSTGLYQSVARPRSR